MISKKFFVLSCSTSWNNEKENQAFLLSYDLGPRPSPPPPPPLANAYLLSNIRRSTEYTECLTFCPFVRMGSPPPHSQGSVASPFGSKKWDTLAWGAGEGAVGTQFRRRDRHSGTLCVLQYTHSTGNRKTERSRKEERAIAAVSAEGTEGGGGKDPRKTTAKNYRPLPLCSFCR